MGDLDHHYLDPLDRYRFDTRYKPVKSMSTTQRQILVWLFLKAAEPDEEGETQGQPIETLRAMQLHDIHWHAPTVVKDWELERQPRPSQDIQPGNPATRKKKPSPHQPFAETLSRSLAALTDHKLVIVSKTSIGNERPRTTHARLTPRGMKVAIGQILHGQTHTEHHRAKRAFERATRSHQAVEQLITNPLVKTEYDPDAEWRDKQSMDIQQMLAFGAFADKKNSDVRQYHDRQNRQKQARQDRIIHRSLTLPPALQQRADAAIDLYFAVEVAHDSTGKSTAHWKHNRREFPSQHPSAPLTAEIAKDPGFLEWLRTR